MYVCFFFLPTKLYDLWNSVAALMVDIEKWGKEKER